jgi:hypothetical protein
MTFIFFQPNGKNDQLNGSYLNGSHLEKNGIMTNGMQVESNGTLRSRK